VTKKNQKKKKKKRSSINHTQEGIGHGRQPAGQVEGEQQEGMWRSKGEKGLGGGEEPRHHQSRAVGKAWNGNFFFTIGRRGSGSTGRRGGSDLALVIADLVGSTRLYKKEWF
jgi:hypothetical protein